MASSSPLPSIPVELPFFPIEVWIKIWDFIDFHTLQKKCTIVSKSWFEVIRNTPTLSGEMELKKTIEKEDGTLETLNADGIDSILSHWPMLKVTSLLTHDANIKKSLVLWSSVSSINDTPSFHEFIENWLRYSLKCLFFWFVKSRRWLGYSAEIRTLNCNSTNFQENSWNEGVSFVDTQPKY